MYQVNRYVCADCFADPELIDFVRANAVENACSFCGNDGDAAVAARVEDVSEYFLRCISREYDLAVNQLGRVGAEGGFMGPHWDAFELATDVLEMEFPQGNEWELIRALFGDDFDQYWCPENAYGWDDLDRPKYSWEYFKKVVKHEKRFFFMDDEGDPNDMDVMTPAEILQRIFEYARQMGLFRELPAESRLNPG